MICHMQVWYSLLYVVVEGYRELGQKYEPLEEVLAKGEFADLLRRYLLHVALQRASDGQFLRRRAGQIHTSDHLILGPARPILGVAFGAKRLGRGRPADLADNGLPRTGRRLDDGRHVPVLRADCTENVLFNAQKAQGVT